MDTDTNLLSHAEKLWGHDVCPFSELSIVSL